MEQLRLVEVEDEGPGETRKQCPTCKRWLDATSGFWKGLESKSGKVTRRPECKRCDQRNNKVRQTFRASPAFAAMLRAQNNRCAASCGAYLTGGKDTHVDHVHGTDFVRGLLCRECNIGGGKLGDDAEAGMRWALYCAKAEGRMEAERGAQ